MALQSDRQAGSQPASQRAGQAKGADWNGLEWMHIGASINLLTACFLGQLVLFSWLQRAGIDVDCTGDCWRSSNPRPRRHRCGRRHRREEESELF